MYISGVKTRLYLLSALMAFGLILLAVMASFLERHAILQERIGATRQLSLAARDVAAAFGQQSALTPDTALDLARMTLRGMHYSGGGYFMVYDDVGNNVVHGEKPEREGHNYLDIADSHGKKYLADLINSAKANGAAVDYFFAKPGQKTDLPKYRSASSIHPGTGSSRPASMSTTSSKAGATPWSNWAAPCWYCCWPSRSQRWRSVGTSCRASQAWLPTCGHCPRDCCISVSRARRGATNWARWRAEPIPCANICSRRNILSSSRRARNPGRSQQDRGVGQAIASIRSQCRDHGAQCL